MQRSETLVEFRERIRKWAGRELHCGDTVCDIGDERHTGTVEAINWNSVVVVRWPNDWLSELPIRQVRKVTP